MRKLLVFLLVFFLASSCNEKLEVQKNQNLRDISSLSKNGVNSTLSCNFNPPSTPTIKLAKLDGTVLNPSVGFCDRIQPNTNYYLVVQGSAAAYCVSIVSGATFTNGALSPFCLDVAGPPRNFPVTSNNAGDNILVTVTPTDDCGTPMTAYTVNYTYSNPSTTCNNATVNISYSAGQWSVTTTNVGNVTLSGISANGFSGTICTGSAIQVDALNLNLTAGSSNYAYVNPNSVLTCTSKRYRLGSSVLINGILCNNGSTVTINNINYKVNISKTTCSIYPC